MWIGVCEDWCVCVCGYVWIVCVWMSASVWGGVCLCVWMVTDIDTKHRRHEGGLVI